METSEAPRTVKEMIEFLKRFPENTQLDFLAIDQKRMKTMISKDYRNARYLTITFS